ncbi:MAG: alpha/beta hydrolase family protein [Dehalococcoidia bacterium]
MVFRRSGPSPVVPNRRAAAVALLTLLVLGQGTAACGGGESPAATSGDIQELDVSFTSGPTTLYGTLLLPNVAPGARIPGAVILSGSGPTERKGNSTIGGAFNTNRNIANALGGLGVASLRFDKLGSGRTGLAGLTDPATIDFGLFVDEAQAALALLRARPEVDPARTFLLGHSEGALITLVLADRLPPAEQPAALVLAAPPSFRYMDIIRRQVGGQAAAAAQAGQLPQAQADAILADLDRIISSVRETGAAPTTIATPQFQPLFNPANIRFLVDVDRYDPRDLAAALPPAMPVLILRGQKDQQVSAEDVERIAVGLRQANNHAFEVDQPANVNHVFKEVPGVPNPAVDYANPDLPFSREAVAHLAAFLARHLGVTEPAGEAPPSLQG